MEDGPNEHLSGGKPASTKNRDLFELDLDFKKDTGGISQTWRTPRTSRADDSLGAYETLRNQLIAITPTLDAIVAQDSGTGEDGSLDTARHLMHLASSYNAKYARKLHASLQKTVARSVANSFARQLQSCKSHGEHSSPVNRALLQIVRKLPEMEAQVRHISE